VVSSIGSESGRPDMVAADCAEREVYLYYVYVNVNYKGFPVLKATRHGNPMDASADGGYF
jgi:hypothetical protein